MGRPPHLPASCLACSKAKRRCGKQHPSCLRCNSKGLKCQYPASKPSSYVLLEDARYKSLVRPPSTSSDHFTRVNAQAAQWWFTSPSAWQIDHPPSTAVMRPRSPHDLASMMTRVQEWLLRWVKGYPNPFIHHSLYLHRFPPPMQDAYLVASSYFQRTPSNEKIIIDIVEKKAQALVANSTSAFLDPFLHLACCQALLIYQIISLASASTTLRVLAERHIPILRTWLYSAISSASTCSSLGMYLITPFLPSPSPTTSTTNNQTPTSTSWQTQTHNAWILTESLRRTFLLASAVHGSHLSSQDGIHHCFGGMMFTSRRGFWDAPDADAWVIRCQKLYSGMISLCETDKLFAMVEMDEIDPFAKFVLEVTFGEGVLRSRGMMCTM